MKNLLLFICLSFFLSISGLQHAAGKDAPTSDEQLRSEFETALKVGDTNAIKSLLYNWQSLPDETNSMAYQDITQNLMGANLDGKIESVKLGALKPLKDYSKVEQMETDDGLLILTPNLAAVGVIEVKVQPADTNDTPWIKELVYGNTNKVFYLRDTVMQKVAKKVK